MDFKALGKKAGKAEDLTKNKTFERELPKAGVAMLRFRDYIELGRHESKNPTHKPALRCILTFELNHPKHMIEIDGKKVPNTLQVRLNKGVTAKSGYRKLFNIMNAASGGKAHHFVELLGDAYLGTIFHNEVGEGDKKQVYANLDKDGAYSITAPEQVDAVTEQVTKIKVPELHDKPSAFLWENEGMEDEDIISMWESIFIEGTREVEDPTTKEKSEQSKNWIQETIMKNLEWEGSRTQALTQEHLDLDELEGGDDLPQELEAVEESVEEENGLAALADSADADDELPVM